MAQRNRRLWENEGFRGLVLTALVLVALVWLFDFSARSAALMGVIVGSTGVHELLDERYGLPEGSKWVFYGIAVAVAGVVVGLGVGALAPWVGGALASVGAWFVLDGVATIRVGGGEGPHDYAADLDDASNSEAMLRMQVLGSVHEELRERGEPRTAEEVADALALGESRAASALDFLESRGQVEHVDGDRYRATEQRWGRLQPVASFLHWLPRRVVRPFRLLLG